ncbi:MAG TPA: hypothetical protein VEV39_02300 [Gemmatimonadales bacterium]|nr:hypothetical protein [Gemmatimonadales bacterium]
MAQGQSGFRVLVGGLELTHEYGLLFGVPLGDGPFSVEGQVGPGGAGGSLSLSWPLTSRDSRDQGLSWFVNAGLGKYFTSASPGTPVGGVLTMIGGIRFMTGGGAGLLPRFTNEGGLTIELGGGFFQTIGGANPDGVKKGAAGRLAIGWEF